MKPPPPGLLSMTTRWFQVLPSFSETRRRTASGPLPAANGVTIVTGLVGKSVACADARPCKKRESASAAARIRVVMTATLPWAIDLAPGFGGALEDAED